MADLKLTNILRSSAREWNSWRTAHPHPRLNLTGAALGGLNLQNADLSEVDLRDADISKADLRRANLQGARLSKAKLVGANLARTNLRTADLTEAVLDGAQMSFVDLAHATAMDARFDGTYMTQGKLSNVNFIRASLKDAKLCHADLTASDLAGADLTDADLEGCECNTTLFQYTLLNGTNLRRAQFGYTILADVDLSNASGLDLVIHRAPSELGLETIIRCGTKIPVRFLRGCGVPERFIEYLPSLITDPIQNVKCFISYSSKDEEFARKLYVDLESRGVRCWFAPEDMRIGDKILDSIDQAIRHREKLLIILSEHSIQSSWVEDEVLTAYEEERMRGSTVLFPVRVDDSVMETHRSWAAKLRANRHIGDFRAWKDREQYQKMLSRLLRDLDAAAKANA